MTNIEKYGKWLEMAEDDLDTATSKIPSNIMNTIIEFIDLLKEENIIVEKVILFGSYAKGTYREDSDIDLAIVSPNFKEEDCIENMTLLLCKANILKADIQTIPFSVEEYNEPKGIMEEILNTGIELKVA